MFSSQNPFYFEICLARKIAARTLTRMVSGRPWMFLPKKSAREAQKKKVVSGNRNVNGENRQGVKGVTGSQFFFLNQKGVKFLEKREGNFEDFFQWSHWNFEDFWSDLEGKILCFWFGSVKGKPSPPRIEDRKGPQTTGFGCRWPPWSPWNMTSWKIRMNENVCPIENGDLPNVMLVNSGVQTFGKVFFFQSAD